MLANIKIGCGVSVYSDKFKCASRLKISINITRFWRFWLSCICAEVDFCMYATVRDHWFLEFYECFVDLRAVFNGI